MQKEMIKESRSTSEISIFECINNAALNNWRASILAISLSLLSCILLFYSLPNRYVGISTVEIPEYIICLAS